MRAEPEVWEAFNRKWRPYFLASDIYFDRHGDFISPPWGSDVNHSDVPLREIIIWRYLKSLLKDHINKLQEEQAKKAKSSVKR